MYDYDVISIGAGSGGCASAMRCADLGFRTALVEYREKGTGGTCVNRGCIPTKVLVKSAQVYKEAKEAAQYGVILSDLSLDHKIIQQKKNTIVNNLRFGLDNFLIKPRKIDRLTGKAKLIDPHTVELEHGGQYVKVTARNIVIATGSEPANIPAFNIDRSTIITSDEALEMETPPQEMIIVGAGALGLEFAYIFSTFGTKVTIVEMMPQVVPAMKDQAMTEMIKKHIEKMGITVHCGSGIKRIEADSNGRAVCTLDNGTILEADKALVAIGRKLNTSDMGLEEAGVLMNKKGQIEVDENMRTSVENIYAVGDIVKGPQLSHKAQREGLVAAEAIAGLDSKMRYESIPWAIFIQPEIAGVGLTEADANEIGIETVVGSMNFNANEKAISMQKTTGSIRIIAKARDHVIIGAQIFGPDASVLIGEIALAVDRGLKLEDLADCIHAHPTLSEIVMETAKSGLGKAFHK